MAFVKAECAMKKHLKEKTEMFDIAEMTNSKQKQAFKFFMPTMKKLKFYAGQRAPDSSYTPSIAKTERGVITGKQDKPDAKMTIDTIRESFRGQCIAIVGPLGSGKTILLKEVARNADNYVHGIKMTYFIECQHLPCNVQTTAIDMFFGDFSDTAPFCVQHAKEHPEQVLFVLDSLDTLQFCPDGVYESFNGDEFTKAYPEVLLAEFLCGNLFPKCHILTSAREYSIRNYKGQICPSEVIALYGFDIPTVIEIASDYMEKEQKLQFEKDLENHPLLLPLCSNPALLKLMLSINKQGQRDKILASSMTELVIQIISYISKHRGHIHGSEEVAETLRKLAAMSYNGIQKGRVIFSLTQLEDVDLDPAGASNFGVLSPGSLEHSTVILRQKGSVYFFVHKCFQEILAAVHISLKDKQLFEIMSKTEIHHPRYAAVRRFLCGLLANHYIKKAGIGRLPSDPLEENNKILLNAMREQLVTVTNSEDRLELFYSVFEAGDCISELVPDSADEIRLRLPLTQADMFVFASVLRHYKTVKSLLLCDCSFSFNHLQILNLQLQKSNTRIKKMDFSENLDLGLLGLKSIGEAAAKTNTEELHLDYCQLEIDEIKGLKRGLKDHKLLSVSMVGEVDVNQGLLDATCALLTNILDYLDLTLWKINQEHRDYIQEKLNALSAGVQMSVHLNRYEELQPSTVAHLRYLLAQSEGIERTIPLIQRCSKLFSCRTALEVAYQPLDKKIAGDLCRILEGNVNLSELELKECNLSLESIISLKESVKKANSKIQTLSVSATDTITKLLPEILELSDAAHVQVLNIEGTNVGTEILESLKHSSKDMKYLRRIVLSGASGIDDFRMLGNTLSHMCITELTLTCCDLTSDKLKELASSSIEHKLQYFDISYNRDISPVGYEYIARTFKKDEVKSIILNGCDVDLLRLNALREGLFANGTKVRHLCVSCNEMGLATISELIDFVKSTEVETLELEGCELCTEEIEILCTELHDSRVTSLGLSDNASIYNALSRVALFVKDCHLKRNLDLSNCTLSNRDVEDFVQRLGDAKVCCLNLSECERTLTADYAHTLSQVIKHVEHLFILRFKCVSEECRRIIMEEKKNCQGVLIILEEANLWSFDINGISIFLDQSYSCKNTSL